MRFFNIIAIGLLTLCFYHPSPANAASSSFRIGLTVSGTDTLPPSTPLNLVAVADSSSQITITWDPSTDDVIVSGYELFRDGNPFATTTSTSYVDIGLTASTTYSYSVRAFDSSGNYSTTSVSVSATTFAPPAPTPTPDNPRRGGNGIFVPRNYPGSSALPFVISNVTYVSSEHSIHMTWYTNYISDAKVLWGKTSDVELGTIYRNQMEYVHSIVIDRLDPGTPYWIRLESMNPAGVIATHEGIFYTLFPREELTQNVTKVEVRESGSDLVITWNNGSIGAPIDVRLVRSERFFPLDPFDGKILYEGDGNYFKDGQPLSGTSYYYSVFTKGEDGRYSSGAVTYFGNNREGTLSTIDFSATSTISHLTEFDPTLLHVMQLNKNILPDNFGVFDISEHGVVEVRLPATILRGEYKTALISVNKNNYTENQHDTFLFSYDAQKGRFVAYIPQDSLVLGKQDVLISYFGFDNKIKAVTRAIFDKKPVDPNIPYGVRGISQYFVSFVNVFVLILILILIIVIHSLLSRKSRESKP